MDKRIILHVGMPKAASTYLQKIFPNLEEVYFEGIHRRQDNPLTAVIRRILTVNPLNVDTRLERDKVLSYLETIQEHTVIISFEALEGLYVANYRDRMLIINLLSEVFPKADVLLVVRRQDAWLESMYKQMLYFGYTVTVNNFLNYRKGEFHGFDPKRFININVYDINLYNTVKYYAERFGRDKIKILPFEKFIKDRQIFVNVLCEKLSLKPCLVPEKKVVNRSYSMLSSYIALMFNRFLIRPYNNFGFIPEKPFYNMLKEQAEINSLYKLAAFLSYRCSMDSLLRILDKIYYVKGSFISQRKRKMIMDIHKDSNRYLAELTGLELNKYGYY